MVEVESVLLIVVVLMYCASSSLAAYFLDMSAAPSIKIFFRLVSSFEDSARCCICVTSGAKNDVESRRFAGKTYSTSLATDEHKERETIKKMKVW